MQSLITNLHLKYFNCLDLYLPLLYKILPFFFGLWAEPFNIFVFFNQNVHGNGKKQECNLKLNWPFASFKLF